jgi:hypothetical protein
MLAIGVKNLGSQMFLCLETPDPDRQMTVHRHKCEVQGDVHSLPVVWMHGYTWAPKCTSCNPTEELTQL